MSPSHSHVGIDNHNHHHYSVHEVIINSGKMEMRSERKMSLTRLRVFMQKETHGNV